LPTFVGSATQGPGPAGWGKTPRFATRAGLNTFAGGFKVLSYRVFFFDRAGHIERAREFHADDDDGAVRLAQTWREGRTMELWQRERRVKRWPWGQDD